MTPAIAAMASTLFRMFKLLRDDARRLASARNPSQFISAGIVPRNMRLPPLQFSAFLAGAREPAEAVSVSYRGTAPADKMHASIRFPLSIPPEIFR
jgi:hypothetical protein